MNLYKTYEKSSKTKALTPDDNNFPQHKNNQNFNQTNMSYAFIITQFG